MHHFHSFPYGLGEYGLYVVVVVCPECILKMQKSDLEKAEYMKVVVDEDSKRVWGDTRLPPAYLAAIDNMRRPDLLQWLQGQKKRIIQHCDDLEALYATQTADAFSEASSTLPDHVKKVFSETALISSRIKNPYILAHESHRVGMPEEFSGNGDATKSVWWKGWPFEGIAKATGLWPHGRPLSETEQKQIKKASSSSHTRKNKKPPDVSNSTDANTVLSFKKGWEHVEKYQPLGLLIEIPEHHLQHQECRDVEVTYNFSLGQKPDDQGAFQKWRAIADERKRNKRSAAQEHMTLPRHADIVAAIGYARTGCASTPYWQTKQDVSKDLSEERKAGKHIREGNVLPFAFRTQPPPQQKEVEPFTPLLAKADMTSAFHQLPVANPWGNIQAYAHPSTRKWKCFFSLIQTLGNYHSMRNWCAGVSVLVEKVCHSFLLPVLAYVDDTIIKARIFIQLVHELARIILDRLGFAVSPDKDEILLSHSSSYKKGKVVAEGFIEILGIQYILLVQDDYDVTVPPKKITATADMCVQLASKFSRKEAPPAIMLFLQKVLGSVCFIMCARKYRTQYPMVAQLGALADSGAARVKDIIDSDYARNHMALHLQEVAKVVASLRPTRLSDSFFIKKKGHAYFDASLEGKSKEVWIAGLYIEDGRCVFAFSHCFQQADLPLGLQNRVIFFYELLAAVCAALFIPAGRSVIFHGDNSPSISSLVKGNTQAVYAVPLVVAATGLLEKADAAAYFVYISTLRNPADYLTRKEAFRQFIEQPPGTKLVEVPAHFLQKLGQDTADHVDRFNKISGGLSISSKSRRKRKASASTCPEGSSAPKRPCGAAGSAP